MKFAQTAISRGISLPLAVAALILSGSMFVLSMPARAEIEAAQRTVQGKVVTQQNQPVSNAIVYLSDQRTMTVESYITQQNGAYRFEQLSPNDNYKLWAQANGKKSKVRTISSFESRNTFHVILTVGSGKH